MTVLVGRSRRTEGDTMALEMRGATRRELLGPTAEGLSGASFERVELDGHRYVVMVGFLGEEGSRPSAR